ncbi:hypothetical protein AVEN_135984-1 [Araneus ventricosus]|uniref:Uncharacterized protein n=1 Tax=Araneus ventricosus TaxID=182803 RepID=A0A4Y2V8H5_ARAVE|nr:hypothetical protein AVEN_33121-1 [Araneus ventricosus]GBO20006.1 hypothetical protein AVEN_135984-1 [Araneus ventricosus]
MSGKKPSEVRLGKPALFPSVQRFLNKNEPEKESPLPNQSRLPRASSSKAEPKFRNLQELEKPRVDQGRLLERNTDMVTSIRNRLATGRKERFYYLTIPGIIRIIEVVSTPYVVWLKSRSWYTLLKRRQVAKANAGNPCIWLW